MMQQRFRDRLDAGQQLAERLRPWATQHPLILGLPRGGVPVAAPVAEALAAPLDVWVVRKVGVPWQPELGLGAVAEGGGEYLSRQILKDIELAPGELEAAVAQKRCEVEERVRTFRGKCPPPTVSQRVVIVVDDGIATGGTVRAALKALRAQKPLKLILAVPVMAAQAVEELSQEVDSLVYLMAPSDLRAVGQWYEDFTQVSDEEVVEQLAQAAKRESRRGIERRN